MACRTFKLVTISSAFDANFCFTFLSYTVVLLGRLVTFSFLENKAKEGPNNRLEKVNIMAVFASKDDLNCSESKTYHICMQISQQILDITVEKSDFLACKKTEDAPSNNEEPDRFVLKRSAFCFYCTKKLFLFGIKFADAVLLSALIVLNHLRLPSVKVEYTKKSFFYHSSVIFNRNI